MKKLTFKSLLLLCALIVGSNSLWAADVTGTINFGSASGSTKIEGASSSGSGTVTYTDTGDDDQGNTWTITTVTSNAKSFTQNASYSQIGASSKPVTSISFTTTLAASQTISAFSAKLGGFSGTAGSVTLKVGETSVGTGSLNADKDVTVSATNTTTAGTVLTVTVTGISKGVKAYYISYTYSNGGGESVTAPTFDYGTDTYNNAVNVKVSNYNANYKYFYTTDGETPSCNAEFSPTGSSALYNHGSGIDITTTSTTLKMIAVDKDDATNKSGTTSATYTLKVADPTFTPTEGTYSSQQTVAITTTTTGDVTIYYTTDGTTPTASSDVYSSPITISELTTLKVLAKKDNFTNSNVKSAIFKILSSKASTYTSNVTLTTTGGENAEDATVSISTNSYDAIKCATSKKSGSMIIEVPALTKKLYIHAGGWNGESATLTITPAGTVTASPTSLSLTGDAGISGSGTFTLSDGTIHDYVITLNDVTEATEITLSSSKRFVVYGVNYELMGNVVQNSTTSATNGYYSTFYAPCRMQIPAKDNSDNDISVTAYTATYSSETLTLHPLTGTAAEKSVIPANTPVVLKASTAGAYTLSPTDEDAGTAGSNDLKGLTDAKDPKAITKNGGTICVLGVDGTTAGFYKFTGSSLGANKAYLIVPAGGTGAPSIRFVVEEENNATNISNVEENVDAIKFIQNGQLFIKKNGVVYDMLGTVVR